SDTFNDTWLWDGTNWTQLAPPESPSARDSAAIAYDSAHEQLVLFGGTSFGGILDDTWVWGGTNWTQLSPPHSPSARYRSSMASDLVRGGLVLFGGNDFDSYLNDTWRISGDVIFVGGFDL
ncbi:MAG TPA: hypothetical protein VLC97_15825, partial [Rhodanobacteraceae bacterium]|nr:hypothetical protein [Rhodanobacteraceae bacterium]